MNLTSSLRSPTRTGSRSFTPTFFSEVGSKSRPSPGSINRGGRNQTGNLSTAYGHTRPGGAGPEDRGKRRDQVSDLRGVRERYLGSPVRLSVPLQPTPVSVPLSSPVGDPTPVFVVWRSGVGRTTLEIFTLRGPSDTKG